MTEPKQECEACGHSFIMNYQGGVQPTHVIHAQGGLWCFVCSDDCDLIASQAREIERLRRFWVNAGEAFLEYLKDIEHYHVENWVSLEQGIDEARRALSEEEGK